MSLQLEAFKGDSGGLLDQHCLGSKEGKVTAPTLGFLAACPGSGLLLPWVTGGTEGLTCEEGQ